VTGVQTCALPICSLKVKQQEAFDFLNHEADVHSRSLQNSINEKSEDARALADDIDIRLATATFNRVIREQRSWQEKSDEVTIIKNLSARFESLNSKLRLFSNNYGFVHAIDIVDPANHITIASSEPLNIVKKNPAIAEMAIDSSPSRGRYAALGPHSPDAELQLILAQKIFNPETDKSLNRTSGLLLLMIDIDLLVPQLVHNQLSETSMETLLVDSRGYSFTPLKHKVSEPLSYKIKALPATLASIGHEGIIATEDYRGEPVLAVFRHIQLSSSMGWGMVTKRDQKEVFAPIYNGFYYNISITIIAVIIMLIYRKCVV